MKIKDHLSKEQRKAVKKIQQINNIELYQFHKGSGFVVLSEGEAIKKTQEQLGKAKVIDEDPTQKYTNKSQKRLRKLRRDKIHR